MSNVEVTRSGVVVSASTYGYNAVLQTFATLPSASRQSWTKFG
jgi:hypothetical protein